MRATHRSRILSPDRSRSLFGLDPPRHGNGSDRQQPELARIAASAGVAAAASIAAAAGVPAAASIAAATLLLLVFDIVADLFVVDVGDRLTPDDGHGMLRLRRDWRNCLTNCSRAIAIARRHSSL